MDIPIVIATYNRPFSLNRIIASLDASEFIIPVKLYISIDGGGDNDTRKIAEEFHWKHGSKEIIYHTENLGLRNHILSCGDLALKHDGIILLEDDIFVSPVFYSYIYQAVDFYLKDEAVVGISLYNHSFNETANFTFIPINDGFDIYFLQLASSWGQCWTTKQWKNFREWYNKNSNCEFSENNGLPIDIVNWPEKSWKKYFIKYMVENNLYFAYPRTSFTTNFGDAGENHLGVNNFQVPLKYRKSIMNFPTFAESLSKYDSYCEILPECINSYTNKFDAYSYEVDLYGRKPINFINKEYLLTSRYTSKSLFSFGRKMTPHETNIIAEINGNDIFFSKLNNFENDKVSYSLTQMAYFHHLPDWCKNILRFADDKKTDLQINNKKEHRIKFKNLLNQLFISFKSFFLKSN